MHTPSAIRNLHPLRQLAALVLLCTCLGAAAEPAAARDQVVAVQKSVSVLSLYDKPYGKIASVLAVRDVRFPLAIVDVDGDFLKVLLAEKEVWLDGTEVAIDKPVEYACVRQAAKPTKVATNQGASAGCK